MNIESSSGDRYWNNPDYSADTSPESPFARPMKLLWADYIPGESRFVRLYDKDQFQREGIWFFSEGQIQGKTPEQLKDLLALPFVPKYVCEASCRSGTRILKYIISATNVVSKSGESVFQVESGLLFFNERPLRPNTPIQQLVNNHPAQ